MGNGKKLVRHININRVTTMLFDCRIFFPQSILNLHEGQSKAIAICEFYDVERSAVEPKVRKILVFFFLT